MKPLKSESENKIRVYFFVFLLMTVSGLSGQKTTDLFSIPENERKLRDDFNKLYSDISDEVKDSLNTSITEMFKSSLSIPGSFFYTWPELNMIGKLKSDDMQVNVFTWHIVKKDNSCVYHGILQYHVPTGRKKNQTTVYLLTDKSASIKQPEKEELYPENWYGALYYSISTHTFRRKKWYTLLGYDFNNEFSNKKIVEIVQFNKNKPVFGETIITESGQVKRLIFEYSSNVVMTLRFDEKLQQIVFDHLAPVEPVFRGSYRFYAPDGSHDALRFSRGKFTLNRDVDARNP